MRCPLCGKEIEADDLDAVEVGGGLAHGDCLAEHDDEGLFERSDTRGTVGDRAQRGFVRMLHRRT